MIGDEHLGSAGESKTIPLLAWAKRNGVNVVEVRASHRMETELTPEQKLMAEVKDLKARLRFVKRSLSGEPTFFGFTQQENRAFDLRCKKWKDSK